MKRYLLLFLLIPSFCYGQSGTGRVSRGASLPAVCRVGDIHFLTSAVTGRKIYGCESANTWALQGDGGAGGGTSFADDVFDVHNVADPTKIIKLLASGITPGNTRTLTAPDLNGILAVTNNNQFHTGIMTFGSPGGIVGQFGTTWDLSQSNPLTAFTLPSSAGAAPLTAGLLAYNSTSNRIVFGSAGTTGKVAFFTGSDPVNGNCVKWGAAGTLADQGAICGSGGGGTPGGSTGQVQTRNSGGTFSGHAGTVYASDFSGSDICAQIQNALNASSGVVIADFSGNFGACAGGWNVPPGTWLQMGNFRAVVGDTINVAIGAKMTGISSSGNFTGGTVLQAKPFLNKPVVSLTNDGHWQELAYFRIEGDSANQSQPTIVAGTGASRTANVVTITTTGVHNYLTGHSAHIEGVTDTSFNGFFVVASTPTTTTFTYAQTGPDATSGGGTAKAHKAAGIKFNLMGETQTVHNVLIGDTLGPCLHYTGISANSGATRDVACFAGKYGVAWFDQTTAAYKMENISDNGEPFFFKIDPGIGSFALTINKFKSDSVGCGSINAILIDGTNGGLNLTLEDFTASAGCTPSPDDAIRIIGNNGAAIHFRGNVGFDTDFWIGGWKNLINDSPGSRTIPMRYFGQGGVGDFLYQSGQILHGLTLPRKDLTVSGGGLGQNQIIGNFGGVSVVTRWLPETDSNYGFAGWEMSGTCGDPAFSAETDGKIFIGFNPLPNSVTFNDEDTVNVSSANACKRIRTGLGTSVTLPTGPSWAQFEFLNPTVTIAAAPTGISRATNIVTVTTTQAHNFKVGQRVQVLRTTGCATSPNGNDFPVLTVPTTTTFTYSQTGPNETCGSGRAEYPRWYMTGAWPNPTGPGVNNQTGTTYTFLTTDHNKLVTFSNAASIAATLPQAAVGTFPTGWVTEVENRGAGKVTITPTTSTIDGAASFALLQNQGARIYSNGANYFTGSRGTTVLSVPGSTYDDFNRANGGLGANWTTSTGFAAPTITSNRVVGNAAGTRQTAFYSGATFADDQFSEVTAPTAAADGTVVGVIVRALGTRFYECQYNNANITIRRVDDSATITNITNPAGTLSPGDVLRLEVVGTTLTCFKNGIQAAQGTDSTYASGSPGIDLYDNAAGAVIDNWNGGAIPAVPLLNKEQDWTLLQHFTAGLRTKNIATMVNCSDGTGAAACGQASAGSFVIDAAATTVVVSTTAVTADSQVILTRDNGLGTRLGVTCNTQSSLVLGTPYVSARTAGTSFTVTSDVAPTTNPLCISYVIVN